MLYLIELRGPFLQTLPLSRAPEVSPEEEAEPREGGTHGVFSEAKARNAHHRRAHRYGHRRNC